MREADRSGTEVRFYHARGSMLKIALLGLIFVAAGFYLMLLGFGPGPDHSLFGGIMGVLSLLLGLTGTGFGLFRALNVIPALTLDEKGLYDRGSAGSAGFVAWTDISGIEAYEFMGQRFIGVGLHDSKAFLNRQNRFKKSLMKANRGLVSFPVNIAMQGFRDEAEAILKEMKARWKWYA
ncbi:STM3941 family protein [Saccharibacillus sp. CPCC 101409]|uniref:STM3941 family protein n=1 Tax=Saccharibacillus sp. CPCC 101409 TaxID=3058041 RepID=UPI002670DD8C|nr:STM3941 family protein [Saccharibacillus sp. CPCC 101409]MDO3408352.1 STM3941 family protein [Saccharibacillus sp. CPCC 101409]